MITTLTTAEVLYIDSAILTSTTIVIWPQRFPEMDDHRIWWNKST